jgi:broad specificity phosphatase PhoE
MKLFCAVAAALLLAACATPDYYVMRHLQKAEGANPGLTEEGSRNALALHDFLKPHLPRAIYVTDTLRAQRTAEPIAERLGLTPVVYADLAGLVRQVRAEPNKPVLIVGHSNTVPDIVRRLGGVELRPMRDDEFGQMWLVYGDGATRVRRLAAP